MGSFIENIVTKEVTRKEFLVYMGMICLTLLGIPALLKSIARLNPSVSKKGSSRTFGTGAYGV